MLRRSKIDPSAFAALIIILGLSATAARAENPSIRLSLPMDCRPPNYCAVQNYVDTDPGPGARDHTCGPLTYDVHKGTDFRIPDLAAMRAGVAVLAAADGVVLGRRDGMADIDVRHTGPGAVKDRECGNGVVLGHAGGWTTQYCHMRRNSVLVKKGQRIRTGHRLGLIGLSGKTAFPHVHLVVRRKKTIIDPYTGRPWDAPVACARPGAPLWRQSALAMLPYRPSGVIRAGFSDRVPTLAEIENGDHGAPILSKRAGKLMFWVLIYGLRKGDIEEFMVRGPDGKAQLRRRSNTAEGAKAQWFSTVGKAAKGKPWPKGRYVGAYRLLRRNNGKQEAVVSVRRAVTLN